MQSPFVDLSFAPSLQLVSVVREFVGDFYEHLLGDDDALSRVTLATHEILENAVKYSLDGLTRIRIEHRAMPSGREVVLQTWNRPRPGDLEVLRTRMAELEQARDPIVYYQELMTRASTRTDGSGLGLGRVLAEAEMSVHYALQDGLVCVTAQAPLG
jgi:hypothetical protein